jgi:hypothetical protein
MDEDIFSFLGVNQDVNETELKMAWLRMRDTFESDQKSNLDEVEKRHFRAVRERIDRAYSEAVAQIAHRDDLLRPEPLVDARGSVDTELASVWQAPGGFAQSHEAASSGGLVLRPLRLGKCDFCGSYPASEVHFRHISGRLFYYRSAEFRAELCRPCAIGTGRRLQNKTLIWGWWGLIALIRNIYVIFKNAAELSRVKKFGQIDQRDQAADAPTGRPLLEGRTVFARFGAVVTLGLVGGLAWTVVMSALHPSPTMEVGGCVKGISRVEPIACSSLDASGRIVAFKATRYACPKFAESFVEVDGGVWCIDE